MTEKRRQYLENAFEGMPGGFFIYRCSDGQMLYANQKLIDLLECDSFHDMMDYTGGIFANVIHPDDKAQIAESIQAQMEVYSDHFDHLEYRLITKHGKVCFVEDYGQRVEDSEIGDIFYIFIVDADKKLLAYDVDGLTGLPGMRRFLDYGDQFVGYAQSMSITPAVIYFDLSNFKMYNIAYGQAAGDELLKQVAGILTRHYPNEYVSRFADDHFVVLSDDLKLEERVEAALDEIDSVAGFANVSCRAGIYRIPFGEATAKEAADYAREACSTIQKTSPDRIAIYSDELVEALVKRAYVVEHFQEAMREHYIRMYLQPVVRAEDEQIVSYEALARWIDPEQGMLSPADFITALEESGHITDLDLYMVEQICLLYRHRIDQNKEMLPVSVNLSRYDFIQRDIFKEIDALCKHYDVPRDMIHIEITESTVMQEAKKVRQTMDAFQEAGHQIWMDDFGSGYSSLNLLKDFEFDELKLDMVFLMNLNQKGRSILRYIVAMAKEIGITTLAEGVETEEQYHFLRDIGCEKLQGYYFARPMELTAEDELGVLKR